MPNNYDEVPRVEFSVDMGDFNNVKQVAAMLASLGIPEGTLEFEREYARAKAASKIFIRNAGAEEVDEAQKIESQKVGHSKSGYVPTGTLQGSITPQFSDDGMKVSILPSPWQRRKTLRKPVRRLNKASRKYVESVDRQRVNRLITMALLLSLAKGTIPKSRS